jgi:Ca2+-binding EF-hand superfamily protein
MDRNGDGVIDADEFAAAHAERLASASRRFFRRFDADGDGKVSRQEFSRIARERSADPHAADDGGARERSGR